MKISTTIKDGAVAYGGTAAIIGMKNIANKNRIATVNTVRPDGPPTSIPDADSM